ncbi:MAG: primosomal protein N', partial [Saprospiraceae bacterium]|nr:primosomal protein N' [Saprospiraceae bacterium]
LETYLNAKNGKYGLVKLLERHGESVLPEIKIVDLKDQYRKGLMRSLFSKELKDDIDQALSQNEQILIFQNRRGYSPALQCHVCDFLPQCPNCDVSLTVHNYFEELRCHYCGYRHKLPQSCPQCGTEKLNKLGFGTEKIEDEIKKVFPGAKVGRLDFDTAKTKNAYEKILYNFKSRNIDILVGTQMITKGLDFDNISIVGVLAADKILYFPDFKANERAFQLFTQVSGRAGRRAKKGKVILQTYNPMHPVIQETRDHNFKGFYIRELSERKRFLYPPFFRMIQITLKHKKADTAADAAMIMVSKLRTSLGNRVIGPTVPGISRLRGFYLQQITIKMEKDINIIQQIKSHILKVKNEILDMDGKKSTRIIVNVDP